MIVEDTKRKHRRLVGYGAAKRTIKRLRRFQDLVRHHQRWASELQHARPLEELLPPNTPENHQRAEIARQINRLIPMVVNDIRRVGIPCLVPFGNRLYDPERRAFVRDRETEETYHVIADYFDLPRDASASASDRVMRVLEQAIGAYEHRLRAARWEWINPLAWIASILYAPLWILERATLIDPYEPPTVLTKIYQWIAQILFLVLLSLLITLAGFEIPWEEIVSAFFK